MKHLSSLLIALFTYFGWANLFAQDCTAFITKNVTIGGKHIVQSQSQVLVVRGSYSYSLEFISDEKGITAKVFSKGGVELNQEDEVIFVDSNNVRRSYRFIEMVELTKEGNMPVYQNLLQLNLAAIEWFSSADIAIIYIKNNTNKEMRKFTVVPERQVDFRRLSTCFYQQLDPTKVVDMKLPDSELPSAPKLTSDKPAADKTTA
ncbi:MAG: hypothetical protein ACK4TA_23680, partial [Saprospiraceae bacterium]